MKWKENMKEFSLCPIEATCSKLKTFQDPVEGFMSQAKDSRLVIAEDQARRIEDCNVFNPNCEIRRLGFRTMELEIDGWVKAAMELIDPENPANR